MVQAYRFLKFGASAARRHLFVARFRAPDGGFLSLRALTEEGSKFPEQDSRFRLGGLLLKAGKELS